jgi:DNA-binding NarL/FixJ family response regulator
VALRILLVDDSDVYRATMDLVLGREPDLEVVGTASDGEEGRRLSRDLEPDVVLLDYRLPGGDGSDATRALLRDRPGLRVVCLTAEATPEERSGVLAAGAAAVVEKGDLGALLRAVRAHAAGA